MFVVREEGIFGIRPICTVVIRNIQVDLHHNFLLNHNTDNAATEQEIWGARTTSQFTAYAFLQFCAMLHSYYP